VLHSLRRQGVILDVRVRAPGSFVVRAAPMRALLEAPTRRDRRVRSSQPVPEQTASAVSPATRGLLRHLALRVIDSLGIRDPGAETIEAEMARQLSVLRRGTTSGQPADPVLRRAVERAIREYEDAPL
jgi:hypothetical protein